MDTEQAANKQQRTTDEGFSREEMLTLVMTMIKIC